MPKKFYVRWPYVLIVAIAIRVIYLFATPAGQTPDEIQIIDRVWKTVQILNNISQTQYVPINYPNNVFYYPPLYFYFSAFALNVISGFKTPPTTFESAFLSYSLTLRILSLFLSIGSLILIWKVLERIDLSYQIKISTYIFITLIPTFASFSIYPNLNVLFFFLTTLFFYLLIAKKYASQDIKIPVILGIVAGLAMLAKSDAIILLPLYPTSLLLSGRKHSIFLSSAIFLSFVFVSGGWWYLSNLLKFGSFFEQQLIGGGINHLAPFSFNFYLTILFVWTFITFFATFGIYNNIVLNPIPYDILVTLSIIALVGLIKSKFYSKIKNSLSLKKTYILLSTAFFLNLCIFLAFNLFYEFQPQGKLLFPSIILLGLTLVTGVSAHFKEKYLYLLSTFLFIFLIFINWWSLGCIAKSFHNVTILPEPMTCVISNLPSPPIESLK